MTEHLHHWRIDTPNGPTSSGRCSCGLTRDDFGNSEESVAALNGRKGRGNWGANASGGTTTKGTGRHRNGHR